MHGILQVRVLEWVAVSYPRGSSRSRDQTPVFYVSCFGRWVLYHQRHLGSQTQVWLAHLILGSSVKQ